MLSLDNTYSVDELREFHARVLKGLEKFLETLPEQSVQLGSEMIQTLTLNSKNQIANLEAIEKSLLRPVKS